MVFDNLKKTIAYLLPAGSFAEFWPVMTNVIFGLPQVLSSFLMIIICCFTDCAAATVLAYEAPEADVMLRKPRKAKKDRLVDWQLILQAYGFIGMMQTLTSFAMSYWYLQRNGIQFDDLWFKYGALPARLDQDYVAEKLNVASSIYFVNLVVMYVPFFSPFLSFLPGEDILTHPQGNGSTSSQHAPAASQSSNSPLSSTNAPKTSTSSPQSSSPSSWPSSGSTSPPYRMSSLRRMCRWSIGSCLRRLAWPFCCVMKGESGWLGIGRMGGLRNVLGSLLGCCLFCWKRHGLLSFGGGEVVIEYCMHRRFFVCISC